MTGPRFNSEPQETAIMNILVYCIMHRWRVIRHSALLLRLASVYMPRFARVDTRPVRVDAMKPNRERNTLDTTTTSIIFFFLPYNPNTASLDAVRTRTMFQNGHFRYP